MERLPSAVGGRYEVLRLLDEGGHSLVYLARDARLGRLVALKILRSEHRGDWALTARLEREVRLVAGLSHPNLVALHDWLSGDSGQCAVLEYVPGENLKAYVRRRGRLPAAEAIAILRQVLAALDAIHAAGVVHRDVKPQNVLLADVSGGQADGATAALPTDGRPPRVKLTDLGIARVLDEEGKTPLGATFGTPHYVSPEQALGRPATPASDVYSAGAVLYELLVGRPPFEGEDLLAILNQHAHEPPVPPSSLVAGLTPDLDRVVLRALAKDPRERFATAREFGAALEGLSAAAQGATAGLPTVAALVEKLPMGTAAGRGRLYPLAAAALAGLFAASGFLGYLSSAAADPPTPRPTSISEPSPTRSLPVALAATPTSRPTATASPTASPMPTPTATARPTQAPSPTPSPSPTATRTPSPTPSPTSVPTPTETVVTLTVRPLATLSQPLGTLARDGGRVTIQVAIRGGRDDVLMTVYRGDAIVRNEQRIEGEAMVDISAAAAGVYRVILNNRFSLFTSKQVTLTFRILEPRLEAGR